MKKSNGNVKLYSGVPRNIYYRQLSRFGRSKSNILWALSLKPGDVVHACFDFNEIVKLVKPIYYQYVSGNFSYVGDYLPSGAWGIIEVEVELSNGRSCKLFSCKIKPALSRCELEKKFLSNEKYYIDYFYKWRMNKEESLSELDRRIKVLQSGGHILSENGVLLPEFPSI